MKKLNRNELAKLKHIDARKMIAQGSSNKEINDFIRETYKCGNLSWGTLKKLREQAANTIVMNSLNGSLKDACRSVLELMRSDRVMKLTIDAQTGSMEMVYVEEQIL